MKIETDKSNELQKSTLTTLKGRRYVLCRNGDEAHEDADRQAAILAGLDRGLAHGDKPLVSNKGFRRLREDLRVRQLLDRLRQGRGGCDVDDGQLALRIATIACRITKTDDSLRYCPFGSLPHANPVGRMGLDGPHTSCYRQLRQLARTPERHDGHRVRVAHTPG